MSKKIVFSVIGIILLLSIIAGALFYFDIIPKYTQKVVPEANTEKRLFFCSNEQECKDLLSKNGMSSLEIKNLKINCDGGVCNAK